MLNSSHWRNKIVLRPLLIVLLVAFSMAAKAAGSAEFMAAMKAARSGKDWRPMATAFEGQPLYIYLRQAEFKRDPGKIDFAELQTLLDAHPDALVERAMRRAALKRLHQQGQHAQLLALHRPGQFGLAEDCQAFAAQLALKQPVSAEQAALLYARADQLTPDCKQAFDWLEAQGGLTPAMVQLRFEQALRDRRLDLARALKSRVAKSTGGYAERSYSLAADPAGALASAAKWPVEAALAPHIAGAVERLARSNPRGAEAHRAALSKRYSFSADQIGQMQRAIAIYAAADRLDQAGPWFARMDPAQLDDQAWAWRLRALLNRREFGPALRALDDLPQTLRDDSRWSYVGGRLAQVNAQPAQAKRWFEAAAKDGNFHGFLAADQIEAPYALCDRTPQLDQTARAQASQDPTVARALAWWRFGERSRAFSEWWHGLQQWPQPLRHAAGLLAAEANWYDAAVWALNGDVARSYYSARFPLAHMDTTRQQAVKNGLAPSWVRGLIRAESVWNPEARSSANAHGLMQLLPGTARGVASRHGLSGSNRLNDPDTNIALGSAYLQELSARYGGQPILATAAYNAGPGAVDRWPVAADMPIDLWIETIPYKETREYVPRVLAFTVIYDWRADGKINRLSDRLPGLGQKPVRRVEAVCPEPATPVAKVEP